MREGAAPVEQSPVLPSAFGHLPKATAFLIKFGTTFSVRPAYLCWCLLLLAKGSEQALGRSETHVRAPLRPVSLCMYAVRRHDDLGQVKVSILPCWYAMSATAV